MRKAIRQINILATILIINWPVFSYSQELDDVRFEQVGDYIYITYDLEGNDSYVIQVYCSIDNGHTWGQPLRRVTGAVGSNQKPGKDKRIVWDVLAERDELVGKVRFKVEAGRGNEGEFTDTRDGQIYRWIRIGAQFWMAENLKYKSPSSWIYGNSTLKSKDYGRLYTWYEALKICPAGWHLPSDAEWELMVNYLGGSVIAGGELKEAGLSHWERPNAGATNASGFTALPSGYKYESNDFFGLTMYSYWWTADEKNAEKAWGRSLEYNKEKISRIGSDKRMGFSVRCVKN